MTDLPPCKLCGSAPKYAHGNAWCGFDHGMIALKEHQWTALMSTDADRLDAGRKVMEAGIERLQAEGFSSATSSALSTLDLPTILGIKGDGNE